MKKILITGILLFSALLFAGAQQGYAYQNVTSSPDGGCLNCHTFAGGTGNPSSSQHALHVSNSVACSSCHAGGVPGKNVVSSKCIVCHPQGNPGQCNLVNLASHPKSGVQACLTCHPTCAPTTTTTTITDTTTTTTIAAETCTLTVSPKRFSRARALVLPFEFFTIRADRDSSISFTDPICIFWESEGIDDVIKMRLGEKLIIGYVRGWPTHLTDGDFKVSVTFGDTSETQCGPITVYGSGENSLIQDKRVKVQKSCGN